MIPKIFMTDDEPVGGLGSPKRDEPRMPSKADPNVSFERGTKPRPDGLPSPMEKRDPLPKPVRPAPKQDVEVTVWEAPEKEEPSAFTYEIDVMDFLGLGHVTSRTNCFRHESLPPSVATHRGKTYTREQMVKGVEVAQKNLCTPGELRRLLEAEADRQEVNAVYKAYGLACSRIPMERVDDMLQSRFNFGVNDAFEFVLSSERQAFIDVLNEMGKPPHVPKLVLRQDFAAGDKTTARQAAKKIADCLAKSSRDR